MVRWGCGGVRYTRPMQFPAKRWCLTKAEDTRRNSGDLPSSPHGDGIIDRLLASRAIPSGPLRDAFLEPKLNHLRHPRSMHGMVEAARAVCAAVRTGKRIAIYGDYDVDGVMSTAILWHMLRTLDAKLAVRTYVPHRIEEGYGLNADALRTLRAEGIEVVITVDCGVSSVDEARLARAIGLELIITDHHELRATGEIPQARAVVHPRLPINGEPASASYGELCGAGVAWKFAWMLGEAWCGSERMPELFRQKLTALLPLAAIGTVADVVPLKDENRVIVARGLRLVGQSGIVGIDALLASARVEASGADTEKIAYRLAPRINAAGRMGHAELAIELFTTANARRADDIVDQLGELNEERRRQERAIFEQALEKLAERAKNNSNAKPRGIVLHDEEWNLGIVGIVCSKLVDIHACPVVLITRNKEIYKGSGRSVKGIELHRVLESCTAHLLGHGGHAMAAGIQIESVEKIEAFRAQFELEVDRLLPPVDQQRSPIDIDCACALAEISSTAVVREIASLAPFGRDNRKPSFQIDGVEITQARLFGKVTAASPRPMNLELVVRQRVAGREHFLRIQWWGGAAHAERFPKGSLVDIVVEVAISAFSRMPDVEATLIDIREAVGAEVLV